jgi:hypothetical protein
MDTLIIFISRLIYGTGAEAVITPNHRQWVAANPSPTGTQWLDHHVDAMLPAYEAWLAGRNLPPVTPWDGSRPEPWNSASDIPVPVGLDGNFAAGGINTLADLGTALKNRLNTVAGTARELNGAEKAPFSFRYWGYMKWAQGLRSRFQGEPVVPPAVLYDRDGTPLSAIPFFDVYNQCHRSWHVGATPASGPTPGLSTSAGQIARSGGVGMSNGEEFIRFHHDHNEILFRWLARQGLEAVRPINMSEGWPQPAEADNNPSTWTEPDSDPWINAEGGDTDNNLQSLTTSVQDIGNQIGGYHVSGHGANTDLGPLSHNNYVLRFFGWHGSVDGQWFWREPRFARWNATTGLRERVFRPILSTGADWPGLHALTIVRDPAAASDAVSPADAVSGIDLTTGAGTLRMRFFAKDPYGRNLTLRLKAEVFDDATSTTVPVETIPEFTKTVGAGGDFALDTEFDVDFAFTSAFLSDDPARANPAVGFVNSRIRVTGSLTVADGTDPGFVHQDFADIELIQEKQAPLINLYLDISTFGEDQVNSALTEAGGTEARFARALIVTVQDRTSRPASIAWPPEVVNEVKGLLTGFTPAAGLFDAPYQPEVVIWRDTADTPFTGLTVELAEGPLKEDASLPDNVPQRYTYFYDVVFAPGHDAFDGLATGGSRLGRVRIEAQDRSGNGAQRDGEVRLLRAENPFMRDGDPPWMSVDTRVFRLFAGDDMFDGVTLASGQPLDFIQDVLAKLNDASTPEATRNAYFDNLPQSQQGSALEYSQQITDHTTGTTRQVYNFAVAKVRLQGASGAADVRGFFRLFRYTASNLIFDDAAGYRFFDAGGGVKVPLLGFTAAGQTDSIPFFATARVPYTSDMTTQTDPPNVQTFAAGPTAERVLYFAAYLDINQPGVQLPATRVAAHPDGPFAAAEVQPIRTLMMDAHQCMVVEIKYDADATETGATPANSDNLAQRNLLILTTDNPGSALTHTVQHSFEVDQGCCRTDLKAQPRAMAATHAGHDDEEDAPEHDEHEHEHDDDGHGHSGHDHGGHDHGVPHLDAERAHLRFLTTAVRDELVHAEALSLSMSTPREGLNSGHHSHHDTAGFVDAAAERIDQLFPFTFDGVRWQDRGDLLDELLFRWNDLPADSRVELYLPGVRAENVINLRHLRHAPGDVRIVDEHTLLLVPSGVTFVPLPPSVDERVAGVVTVTLPERIRKGQRWVVDVAQIRGGEQRTTGGFRLDIQVSEAKLIADAERRLLGLMFERLSLLPKYHRWRPVLKRRVETIRARAEALADSAGVEWTDPTEWTDPHDGTRHPFEGQKIRVVLDRFELLEDRDPWIKGKGEVSLSCRVYTSDNGGHEQRTRIPEEGVFKVSDRPGRNVVKLDREIFEGYVVDDLRVEVVATEEDLLDPDDTIGKYTRLFCEDVNHLVGEYGPDDERLDPEEMVAWRVWYRIERA